MLNNRDWKKGKKEKKRAENMSIFLQVMKQKKEDGSLGQVWDEWKWILTYTKRYKGAVFFYILSGIASTTFSLVSAVASKYVIDIITSYQTSRLWMIILIMVLSMVISLVLTSATSRISARLSIDINNDIQTEIFEKISDADWMSLNQFSNGDLINRFNTDISAISSNAINWLPTLIVSLYQFLSTFAVIWYYSPTMALIALSGAPFLLLISKAILRRQRAFYKKVRSSSSRVMAYEVEAFYNLDTIKSFGITGHYTKGLKDRLKENKKIVLDYNGYSIFTNAVLSLLSSAVEFVAFGYCLWQLWNHQISFGTMTLFLQQRSSLTSAFNKAVSIIPTILTASVSAGRIRELISLPSEQHSTLSEETIASCRQGTRIELNDVDFSYAEGRPVITNSQFEASPGEIIAVVGPSGEGKTTLIRLILGLIQPQNGESLLVSGEDGVSVHLNADTRPLFSYVPQGNTILSGTIAENLRMVKEDATNEELEQALKQACAWDFVLERKGGIHSMLGERGRGLSEGQAQRIAIARAILRDAPVLLLDEATSALDVATERKVLKNIMTENPQKTVIVTTHRPSVLNLCKRVYRIMDGRITPLSEEESSRMAMDF